MAKTCIEFTDKQIGTMLSDCSPEKIVRVFHKWLDLTKIRQMNNIMKYPMSKPTGVSHVLKFIAESAYQNNNEVIMNMIEILHESLNNARSKK